MEEKKEKIVLPKELQEDMIRFFLRTSIPTKKRLQLLSKTEEERKKEIEEQQNDKS